MDAIDRSVREIAEQTSFSGVVRVDVGRSTVVEAAFGMAHRGFDVPNLTTTQFAIASGSKGLTALAVVSLVADGTLTLKTRARSVLGADLPLITAEVTVAQLLSHTSGIGDYIDEEDEGLAADDYLMAAPIHTYERTEAFLPDLGGHPAKFAPGRRFAYSNSGYVVLALIAERVSGVCFHELVAERVLRPAGLTETDFCRSDEPTGRMAVGYLYPTGMRTNVHHLPVRGNGDGGIYTTVADMTLFWRAFHRGAIVSDEWVDTMTTPGVSDYGMGFWSSETASGRVVQLVGSDAGVAFMSSYSPTNDTSRTVISNMSDGAWQLDRHVQARIAG